MPCFSQVSNDFCRYIQPHNSSGPAPKVGNVCNCNFYVYALLSKLPLFVNSCFVQVVNSSEFWFFLPRFHILLCAFSVYNFQHQLTSSQAHDSFGRKVWWLRPFCPHSWHLNHLFLPFFGCCHYFFFVGPFNPISIFFPAGFFQIMKFELHNASC